MQIRAASIDGRENKLNGGPGQGLFSICPGPRRMTGTASPAAMCRQIGWLNSILRSAPQTVHFGKLGK